MRDFGWATFFAGFGSFSFMLLIPVTVARGGFDRITIGLVLSSYAVAVLIFGPLWGALSDRLGRRRPILVLGYLIFAGASLLFVVADSVLQFMAFRFLQGVGYAAHPMLTALFSDHFGRDAARRFGALSGAEALGWGMGSLWAGLLAEQVGIRGAFAVAALLPLLSAGIVWVRLPRGQPRSPRAAVAPAAAFPRKLFYLYGTIFVRMSAAIALWSMLPVFLLMFVDSLALVGAVNAVNMLLQPLFMYWLGRNADRLGRLRLVIWGILGSVVTFWLYASAGGLAQILVGQVTISLSWAAMVIGMNTYVMTTAPAGVRGRAFGLLTSSITLAQALGPLLGGVLAETYTIRGMIVIVSVLMLLSLPLIVRLRARDRRAAQQA